LKQAEKLKDIIITEEEYGLNEAWRRRATFLHYVRRIYKLGLVIAYPENVLWDTFETMCEDLMEGR